MSNLRFKVVEEAFKKRPIEVKSPSVRPSEYYAKYVFNQEKMFKYLPLNTYKKLREVIEQGTELPMSVADEVAKGMKKWAMDMGVTHCTHWFQPLTEGTAEKHDAFVVHDFKGGMVEDFSGKELVQQEPDASSFPNGGIRSTFEARGYSAWDPASPVFIIEDTLMIPTVFISYTGEALDYKAPLKKSLAAVDKAATAVAKYFDPAVTRVTTNLGWEQEYFLVDEGLYAARPDLLLTGRTLMGHDSAKNQQMDDHYFGAIPERVAEFMRDLEIQALELGIPCKTRHNEVAPNQFELAPIFEECNLAVDHNMLLMSLMRKVARKHGFRCLLHEKPFAGINGSGKHNNWSLTTNTGVNLLEPGETPYENAQFLLFLCAVIQAVDDYQDMLRISVASAGNDHRLGANEAPPAIMSIFVGTELESILTAIENEEPYGGKEKELIKVGVHVLPKFPKDTTDRNRTSPFAFTGNKFEFRMLGSSNSISGANVVLNTAVAESLRQYADILEAADDFETALHNLIRDVIKKHRRIIFNGNGYDSAWVEEAEKRGLLNLRSTPDCVPYYLCEKNVALFTQHRVYTPAEINARYEIKLDNYCKVLHIEALTMLDMVWKDILPAVSAYSKKLASTALTKKALSADIDCSFETELSAKISTLTASAVEKAKALELAVMDSKNISGSLELAKYYKDAVFAAMNELRIVVDELETNTAARFWPYPSYGDILFSVK